MNKLKIKNNEPWHVIEIKNWHMFYDEIEKLAYREWVFRGQSDSTWGIKSSLYRLFEDFREIFKQYGTNRKKFAKNEHERLLIKKFQANAHLYINHLPSMEDKLEWCSIMQHYGAPTRLIDATFSPYIALYFALEAGYKDCCIFAFKPKHFTEIDTDIQKTTKYKEYIFDDKKGINNESFFIPYEPKYSNERLQAQQGLFLVPSTNYRTFDKIVDLYETDKSECRKYIIPSTLRYEGLTILRRMNISASNMFPGIDGFSKSLRYQILDTTEQLQPLT